MRLARVRLHHAHAGNVLRERCRHETDALAHPAIGAVGPGTEPHGREGHQGQDRQRGEREPPVEEEQHHSRAHEQQEVLHEARDAVRDERVERLDVVRDPAHDGAGAIALEVPEGEPLQVREDEIAEIGERALPHPAREVGLQRREHERQHAGGGKRDHDPREGVEVSGTDTVVDRELGEVRRREPDDRESEEREHSPRGAGSIGQREPQEHLQAAACAPKRPVGDRSAALLGEMTAGLPDLHADTPISWSSPNS